VYKTTKRSGTITATGHSNNYVCAVELPVSSDTLSTHWIKRGVAMISQLND
jgi:dynein heavy chain